MTHGLPQPEKLMESAIRFTLRVVCRRYKSSELVAQWTNQDSEHISFSGIRTLENHLDILLAPSKQNPNRCSVGMLSLRNTSDAPEQGLSTAVRSIIKIQGNQSESPWFRLHIAMSMKTALLYCHPWYHGPMYRLLTAWDTISL